MPNWCHNRMRVIGAPDEVEKFRLAVMKQPDSFLDANDEDLSFHSTVPQPKFSNDRNDERWYAWRVARWGTKWQPSDVTLTRVNETTILYDFQTAWSPPIPWLEETVTQFQNLRFELWYAEEGMGFAGITTFESGEKADEESMDTIEAHIKELGAYDISCEACLAEDIQLTHVDQVRICPNCLEHRCFHCEELDTTHVEGKCMFDATTYSPYKDHPVEKDYE